jgi:uncharacterized protein YbaA (DUF1428 family)
MNYIDGFVLPVPTKNIAAYRAMARKGGRIWRKHGALGFFETVGDDLAAPVGLPFPKLLKLKKGELAVFSWILYKSRAHRDRVNALAMKDPAMHTLVKKMPFDMNRMSMGGFKVFVDV